MMLPLLTLLQLLDIWTTHKCLSRSNTVESNPILAKLFGKLGILPTLVVMKGAYIALLWWGEKYVPVELLYAIAAFYCWVVLNNLRILRSAK